MTEVVTNQETQQAPTEPTGIQIADVQSMLNIVDLASQRGAFRANELSQVGAVADKFSNFLKMIADQQKAKAEAEAKAKGETAPAETSAPASAPAETSAPASAPAEAPASTEPKQGE